MREAASLWSVAPRTSTSKKTSKKLSAMPVGVNGRTSSRPGVLLTCSSISPVERWNGDSRGSRSRKTMGPARELVPRSSSCVISVETCSRPLPSVSRTSLMSTTTVVGPLSSTVSKPAGVWIPTSAREIGK